VAFADRLELRARGDPIAARRGGARRRQPRAGPDVVVAGGLRQQFLGAGVVALVQRVQAIAQPRPGAAVAMHAPAAERQRQQFPRQPGAGEYRQQDQQSRGDRGAVVGAAETHQYVAGIGQQQLRQQRPDQGQHDPEQQVAEQAHRAILLIDVR